MQYPTIAQPQFAFAPTFAGGGMTNAAQAVQSQGRGNDSMLVHMTPSEVKGLQALAMAHGGSLTINPATGLPEAGFLDAILPIVAGFALGPAGFALMSAPMAALTVGGVTALSTGDLGKGLMAGLGAFGGANIGAALSNTGTQSLGAKAMAEESARQIAQDAAAAQAQSTLAGTALPATATTTAASTPIFGTKAGADAIMAASQTAPTGFNSVGAGVKDLFSSGGFDRFGTALSQQAGGGLGATASVAGVGLPLLEAVQPSYDFPSVEGATSNYAGPYRPAERQVRYPTNRNPEDSSEFLYFTPTNPYPGVMSAASGGAIGYAEGGRTEADYGFQPMATAVAPVPAPTAGLGAIAPGSTIPAPTGDRALRMPGANYVPGQAAEFNYNFKPIEVRKPIPPTPEGTSSPVARLFGKTLFGGQPEGSIEDSGSEGGNVGGMLGRLLGKDKEEGYENYTDLAQYKYDAATQSLVPVMAQGGLAALNAFNKGGTPRGGRFLQGPGDGTSDSIPATIGGTQPARLADGEFVVDARTVSEIGNGSSKAGAKKLYAMMERVHSARKKAKRGQDTKADRFLPA